MTLSPAERYARARTRRLHPEVEAFQARLSFDLDPFQVESCVALAEGSGVLVAAPTGAGKTAVAEFAVPLAMSTTTDKVFTRHRSRPCPTRSTTSSSTSTARS